LIVLVKSLNMQTLADAALHKHTHDGVHLNDTSAAR